MSRSSSISAGVVLKTLWKFIPRPWIASKLLKLQLEKEYLSKLSTPDHYGRAGKIRQVSFRVTDICNLRCHTCGQWGENGFLLHKDLKELKSNEVSPDRYLELLVDLVRKGHRPLVYFWGGEPMLYEGILNLIEGAAELGLPPAIATNGTRLGISADRFVEAPLYLLQVSIDGHCADLHNSIRPSAGKADSFGEINSGLDALNLTKKEHRSQLPLIASLTVVSESNSRHLIDIYEAFCSKVDLFVFYLSWWIDEEHARMHEEDFCLRFGFVPQKHRGWIGDWKPEDYRSLDLQFRHLQARSRAWNNPPVIFIPSIMGEKNLEAYYKEHKSRFGFDRCVSISHAVEVNSNGDVSPCRDYHDFVVGNVKDDTISELWNSLPYREFRQSLYTKGLMPVCSRCCGLMGY